MSKGLKIKLSSIEDETIEYTRTKEGYKHKFRTVLLSDVNDKFACVTLLQDLNDLINTLYKLSDSKHYLEYIFNSSTITDEKLEEEGLTSDFFIETASKFERLRSIVFGDNLDWEALFNNLYFEVLDYEHRWKKFEEEHNRKLVHNEKIYLEKLRELGAVKEDGSVDVTV